MVGDDIVDLASAPADKHRDARFVMRVLAPRERSLLERCPNGDRARLLWLFWAAKEAGYKIANKLDPDLAFAHARFRIAPVLAGRAGPGAAGGGLIHHDVFAKPVPFRWRFLAESAAVHVVACHGRPAGLDAVRSEAQLMSAAAAPRQLSRAARRVAIDLAARAGIGGCQVSAPTVNGRGWPGRPWLTRAGVRIDDWDLSLSHDGHYVSAALGRVA